MSDNIRTLEKLEEILDKDIAWRKKEMLSLKILVERDAVNEPILLRAGIALLCAHFEGFVKGASDAYIRYVSAQKIKLQDLKANFLSIKMREEFKSCAKSDKDSVHKKLILKHNDLLIKKFKVSNDEKIVSTHSNPSSTELKEILETIGIDSDIFETKAHYIDSSLLSNRHKVVHGENSNIDKDDFLNTFKIIMKLIDEYKGLIAQTAEDKRYLKRGE